MDANTQAEDFAMGVDKEKLKKIKSKWELLLLLFLAVKEKKKWWLIPLLFLLAFLSLFVNLLNMHAILPAIYTFF